MIAAGESCDQLDTVLLQLIHQQEQQRHLKNKITKAVFYPACVFALSIIICIGLLLFVVPQFSAIYSSFGGQLPVMTRALITCSHALSNHGLLYASLLCAIGFAAQKIFRKNTRYFSRLLLRLPMLRSLIITQFIAEWGRILSMTLSSGLPLITALSTACHSTRFAILQSQLQAVREAVIAGKSLHRALNACPYFPDTVKQMIAIAENADALDAMMGKIALRYHQMLEDQLERLSKLLEPVMMIGVASVVAGIIIALYLPIFRMGSVL